MPLSFWATQTAVAVLDLCAGIGKGAGKTYLAGKISLPPHMAATVIQRAYHFYIDNEWEWRQKLSWAGFALELEMNWAMHNLWDSDNFVLLVSDGYWLHCLDNG
jgi:hypothetical protein